jgi:group I intron endonuclease
MEETISNRIIKTELVEWISELHTCNQKMVIYLILNKINGKIYVGKTSKELHFRIQTHIKNIKHKNFFLYRAFRKYGINNFVWAIIEKCQDVDSLSAREKYWISYFDSANMKNGYNLTYGGEGCSPNEATKKKISLANAGRISPFRGISTITEKGRLTLSQKMIGNKNGLNKICSIEKRNKIRASLLGRKRSKIECMNISRSLIGKKRDPKQYEKAKQTRISKQPKIICIDSGVIYDNIESAKNLLNVRSVNDIVRVCRGQRKQYKGIHFAYA